MYSEHKVIVSLVTSDLSPNVEIIGAKERIERYKKSSDRVLSRNAYGALSNCLEYLGIIPSECVLTGEGKPYILNGESRIEFSNSHSGAVSVSALGGALSVGADIEAVDFSDEANAIRKKIAKRFFSDAEYRFLSESDSFASEFTRMWTRHEALGKFLGDGMFFGDTEEFAKKNGIFFFSTAELDPKGYILTLCAEEPVQIVFV